MPLREQLKLRKWKVLNYWQVKTLVYHKDKFGEQIDCDCELEVRLELETGAKIFQCFVWKEQGIMTRSKMEGVPVGKQWVEW